MKMRLLMLFGAIALFPACALQPDYIEVRHQPVPGVEAIRGAERVGVSVEARDARPNNRDRVSVKKNGYGMEMAPIVALNDVIVETRQAVIGELQARGFQVGGQDARLEIEVLRFFSEFRTGFWAGSAAAELSVNVRVLDSSGRITFARTFTAEGINPDIQLASGSNAQIALETGLQRLIRAIGDDAELARALLALAPAPQLAPEPETRSRRRTS